MWNVNHSTTAFEIMKMRRPNPLAIYFLLCCPEGKNIFCYRLPSLIASHRKKNTPERRNFQVRWEMPTVPRYETRWESVGKMVVDMKPWKPLGIHPIFRNLRMFQKLTKGSQWTSSMGTSGNFCASMWKESHNSLVGESMMQLQVEHQILLTCDFFVGVYESSKGKDPWYPARGSHAPSLPAHVAVDSGRMLEYHFQSRTSTDGLELRVKEWLAQWVVSGWWGDMDFFVVSLRWQILRNKTILWQDAIQNAKNMGHLRIFEHALLFFGGDN